MNGLARFARQLVALLAAMLLLSACASQLTPEPAAGGEFLQRKEIDDFQFRIMSWNVRVRLMMDEPERRLDDLARITRAVQPDIIVLQEIMLPGMEITLPAFMNREAPPGGGINWHFHHASDNAVLSRFPMVQKFQEHVAHYPYQSLPDFHYGQALVLADLPDDQTAGDVFLVAMHNKSGTGEGNVRLQQMQSDSIVSTLRQRLQQDSPLALPPGTPMIIAGDMNVIDSVPALHYRTLVTGDIADEDSWGPDFPLDWDGSDLADARPSHNARGVHYYTWRDDSTPFPPGRFDRVLYTDSVLVSAHGFVLNTTLMSDTVLERLGLEWQDSLWNHRPGEFDHLPIVVDFTLPDHVDN